MAIVLFSVWGEYFFLEHTQPTVPKLWLCTAIAVCVLFGIPARFGKEMFKRGSARAVLPAIHILGITILMVAMGVFMLWAIS
jgi:hypothetical protein